MELYFDACSFVCWVGKTCDRIRTQEVVLVPGPVSRDLHAHFATELPGRRKQFPGLDWLQRTGSNGHPFVDFYRDPDSCRSACSQSQRNIPKKSRTSSFTAFTQSHGRLVTDLNPWLVGDFSHCTDRCLWVQE
jgi:hypothetical protein